METTAKQPKRMMPARRVQERVAARELPDKPRFLREIVVAQGKNGIVADGSGRLVVLQGNATKVLIPDLIRLMDGTRTIDELYSALEAVPRQHVRAAISVLTHSGLVADCGEAPHPIVDVNRNSLALFERFIGVSNHARNGSEVYSRLQSSHIALISAGGSAEWTKRLAELLTATGAGSATCLASDDPGQLQSSIEKLPSNALLIVLSLTPEDRRLGALVDACCEQRRISWLRVGLDESGTSFDIGPIFGAKRSVCYSCFLSIHSQRDPSQAPAPAPLATLAAEFWLGFVATEITFLQTQIGGALTATRFRRYSLGADSSQVLNVFRVPGCARCRPVEAAGRHGVPTALVYEDYVGVQQRPSADSADKETDDAQVGKIPLRALTNQTKELPHTEQVQLVRSLPNLEYSLLDLLRRDRPQANRPLGLDELGQILMLSVGIRRFGRNNGILKRWGATSGNLGSVEAFMVANSVDGLSPGLYFYQARNHSLARVDNDSSPIADFIAAVAGGVNELPDALLIFTGAYHRVAQKYGPFAYKLINFDAGVAASQLGLIASALGITAHQCSAWNDHAIEKRLHLEPFQEQVTTVLALYSARGKASQVQQNIPLTLFSSDDAGMDSVQRPPQRFCAHSVATVTETLYRESRLRPATGTAIAKSSESMPRYHTEAPMHASLPGVIEGGRSLAEVLSHRASIRRYTNDPVSLTQLAGILASAHNGDRHDWMEDSRAVPLEFLVLASRVEGLEPGAYIYDPWETGLRRWRTAYSPEHQGELFLQEEFAHAPLTVWIFGNMAAACEKHGGFGHRQLLLRAGAAAHRFWMAALSLGMQGCPVAGIVPGSARSLLGLDGYIEASLMAFTGGHTNFEQLRQPRGTGGKAWA